MCWTRTTVWNRDKIFMLALVSESTLCKGSTWDSGQSIRTGAHPRRLYTQTLAICLRRLPYPLCITAPYPGPYMALRHRPTEVEMAEKLGLIPANDAVGTGAADDPNPSPSAAASPPSAQTDLPYGSSAGLDASDGSAGSGGQPGGGDSEGATSATSDEQAGGRRVSVDGAGGAAAAPGVISCGEGVSEAPGVPTSGGLPAAAASGRASGAQDRFRPKPRRITQA